MVADSFDFAFDSLFPFGRLCPELAFGAVNLSFNLMGKIWFWWKKIGLITGNFISNVVLTVFYFTIFAVFAIIFKIFSKTSKNKETNFVEKKSTISKLAEFKNEY